MSTPFALVALLSALAAAVLVAGAVRGGRGLRGVLVAGIGGDVRAAEDPLVDWIAELRRTPDRDPMTPAVRVDGGVAYPRRDAYDEPRAHLRQPPAGSVTPTGGGLGGGRVPAGGDRWSSWNAAGRSPWPWSAGDDPGAARPAGSVRPGDGDPGRARPPARRDARRPGGTPAPTAAPFRRPGAASEPPDAGLRARWLRSELLTESPRRALLLAASVGAGAGLLLAGPVAAVAVGTYGTLIVRALLRRKAGQHAVRARRHRLDQLCGLAADLRAGLPVPVAAERLTSGAAGTDGVPQSRAETGSGERGEIPGSKAADDDRGGVGRLDRLAGAAVRLADETGAPLAELLERIEADARASDRGLAGAEAQAAGARATALLLAVLPLGGIGLGYGIGVDPVAVLLHTPVGGACAVVAIALQVAGLFWAERLGAAPGRAS